MVKKAKKQEKSPKDKEKEKETKQERKKKNSARRRLHYMAMDYTFEKNSIPFTEYLEETCKKDDKINKIVTEAKLDSDSISSVTNFLEDNEFSGKDSSSDEEYKDEEKEENDEKKDNEDNEPKKDEKNDNGTPLQGKIIVLSGSLIIPKEYLKVILLKLGAKVTTRISNRTDILIHGEELDDGRNIVKGKKFRTAKAKKKIEIFLDRDFEKYMEKLLNRKWSMRDEAEKIKL